MTPTHLLGASAGLGLALALGACSGPLHTFRAGCTTSPAPGLYEVIARECENPLDETDYCPLTQYIEIAPSEVYGVPDGHYALAFWYAEERDSTEYSYEADTLRGYCLTSSRFVLAENVEAEGSLILRDGVPVEYHFVSYTDASHSRLLFRIHFSLAQIPRTPALDRRLRIVH
jgi:hypothetical protein